MNPMQTVNQALQLLSRGQVQHAANLSTQLLGDAPDHAQVHYLACEVAIAKNQIGQALQHINRAIEVDGQEAELRFKKAQIEIIHRWGLDAQNTATIMAAQNPDIASIQLNAAKVFSQCDNHAGAEAFLLKARALGIKSPDFLFEFAKNQFYLGKTLEAEQAGPS
jgi:predicted Zn-dependent protease